MSDPLDGGNSPVLPVRPRDPDPGLIFDDLPDVSRLLDGGCGLI